MNIRLPAIAVSVALAAPTLAAAQSGERSIYDTNRECLDRNAPSEKCVIDDGPPVHRAIRSNSPYTGRSGAPARNARSVNGGTSGNPGGGRTTGR